MLQMSTIEAPLLMLFENLRIYLIGTTSSHGCLCVSISSAACIIMTITHDVHLGTWQPRTLEKLPVTMHSTLAISMKGASTYVCQNMDMLWP